MVRVTRSLSPAGDETQPLAAPADTVTELSPGSVVAEKLRIVREVGVGGMGAVFEVEHLFTKHHRALKVLNPRYAERPDAVERFLREASAAGRIGNAHIVDTFDVGQLPSGAPFIVMELLTGQPLDELLQDRGKLSVQETVALIGQACEGVAAAHAAGIVHRDLKPQNLFVVTRAGEPFVKLIDFGISKFDPELLGERALTREGGQLGTPFYMAPEQLRGDSHVDPRVDVYALGIILYECVAGQRPFQAKSLSELSIRINQGEYAPLGDIVPDVPSDFVEIVRRAMHHDVKQRIQSAAELASLLRIVVGDPLADTVYSPPPETAPRRPLLLVLALVVTVIAGIVYGTSRTRAQSTSEKVPVTSSAISGPEDSLQLAAESAAPLPSAPPPTSVETRSARARPSASERRSIQKKLNTENPY